MIDSCWIIPCDSQLCLQNVYAYQKTRHCVMVTAVSLAFLFFFCLFPLNTGLCVWVHLLPLVGFIFPTFSIVTSALINITSSVLLLCSYSVCFLVSCQFVFSAVYLSCNSPHNLLLLLLVLDFFLWIFLCWFLFRLICSFLNHQPPFLFVCVCVCPFIWLSIWKKKYILIRHNSMTTDRWSEWHWLSFHYGTC